MSRYNIKYFKKELNMNTRIQYRGLHVIWGSLDQDMNYTLRKTLKRQPDSRCLSTYNTPTKIEFGTHKKQKVSQK